MQRQQIDPAPPEPVDTDVDLHSGRPARHRSSDAVLVAVVAVGCAIGASARYLIGEAWPTPQEGFLRATINVSGCALICVLMVVTDVLAVWVTANATREFGQ